MSRVGGLIGQWGCSVDQVKNIAMFDVYQVIKMKHAVCFLRRTTAEKQGQLGHPPKYQNCVQVPLVRVSGNSK